METPTKFGRYQTPTAEFRFNATTGTSLHGLHKKDRWLAYGECLSDGMTIRDSAKRCKLTVSTSFRWRHRFLGTQDPDPSNLKGIVEADETYVLESRKGDRNLDRKARRRGGKASKRGLSDEQVPILVAADRSGTTACSVLPSVTAASVQSALKPRIDDDILLGHGSVNSCLEICPRNAFLAPPCAKALGIKHEALNQSAGERVRGTIHIQTVNNRHSGIKGFLRHYRGVSSKYLGNYLRWYGRSDLLKSSPGSYLAVAIEGPPTRFAN